MQSSSFGVFFLLASVLLIFGSVYLVFWVLAIMHLLQHKDIRHRAIWAVLVVLVPAAAIVYYFAVLLPYNRQHPYKPKAN